MSIILRAARPEDDAFLLGVYASTRTEEMALVPWAGEQKQAFLQMQFNAQRESYRMQFPGAEDQVILQDAVPVGRIIVAREHDRIELMDIALLPAYRGAGIGTTLIRDLQAEAARGDKPLRLYVESYNPAHRLYERLGFSKIGEVTFYDEMEWRAMPTNR
ncbi:MAG: GNAT family N-acetyltransferase [Anaerolineae bacterium]